MSVGKEAALLHGDHQQRDRGRRGHEPARIGRRPQVGRRRGRLRLEEKRREGELWRVGHGQGQVQVDGQPPDGAVVAASANVRVNPGIENEETHKS